MANWDLAIVGGGAAGIMAAVSAKLIDPKIRVVIMERSFAIGRKILISGAGRCNITNINFGRDNWEHRFVSDTPQTMRNIFRQYGYQDIISFFEDLGVEIYEETKNHTGKIFPTTDSAKNVVALLVDELSRLGVEMLLNTSVSSISKQGDVFAIETVDADKNRKYSEAKKVILCAGGKTYPVLGTDGTGFELALKLGHMILPPVPAAGPVTSNAPICKALQGTKVYTKVDLFIENKKVRSESDEILFTQYGLSGTVIFYLSRDASIYFNRDKGKGNCFVNINFVPDKTKIELQTYLESLWHKRPGQQLELSLYGLITNKLALGLLTAIGLNPRKQVKDLAEHEKQILLDTLTCYRINLSGTRSWEESEFTSGGVRLSEVNPKTLESNMVPGLFLCGEILNVDGDVGGFNLSWAWSSGWVAGKLGKIG